MNDSLSPVLQCHAGGGAHWRPSPLLFISSLEGCCSEVLEGVPLLLLAQPEHLEHRLDGAGGRHGGVLGGGVLRGRRLRPRAVLPARKTNIFKKIGLIYSPRNGYFLKIQKKNKKNSKK